MPISSYILAGGKSTRFGSDKARAVLDDKPLIVHVAEKLRPCVDEVLAIADVAGKYDDLGITTVADLQPGSGPIAGVETALADQLARRGPGWVILVSCDFAGLRSEWIETISRHLTKDARAVAFREDFWQPFPAAYHTDLLPIVSHLLREDRASFQQLLSDDKTASVALPIPADWPELPQINTPEEMTRFTASRREFPRL